MRAKVLLALKGFCMGLADIIPGVSGGTIAFITGVYDELLAAVASVNKQFFALLLNRQFKAALNQIHYKFLINIGVGIFSAIILGASFVHFAMDNYPVYTWSLFLGLISVSIFFVAREIEKIKDPIHILFVLSGTAIAYGIVSLIPVKTPHTPILIFFSGAIAICAMILPGVSGSFLLLILGKYAYITGLIKNPLASGHISSLLIFCAGCATGLLGFSKLLNFLLSRYRSFVMAFLTGFMIGSLKKLWPWKEAVQTELIRGKLRVLDEQLYLPSIENPQTFIAIFIMLLGATSVFFLERISLNSSSES